MPKNKPDETNFDQNVYNDGRVYRITMPKVWVDRVRRDQTISIGHFTFDGYTLKIRIAQEK